jgi:uncharacterized protein YjcR
MASNHKRNVGPMSASPRCGAQTRRGTACKAPAVAGKSRCRMHGGAQGSGAPKNNKNALKHGTYTREAFEQRTELRRLIVETVKLVKELQ